MGRRGKRENLTLILDFILTLNLLSVPFYLSIYFNFQLQFLKSLVAQTSSYFLNILGIKSMATQNFILINETLYEVSWDSTGWKSMYTLFSLIVSLPVYFKRKWKFLILALILTFFFNTLRIVFTIYLSYMKIASFDFLHIFLWREISILFVLFLWFIFLYNQRNNIGETKILLGVLSDRGRKHKIKNSGS